MAVAAAGRISPQRHGVSIKLSSIHERYDAPSFPRIRGQLFERLLGLSRAVAASGIGLTIDAEESERLALQLELFAELSAHPELSGWAGLGIAVQAYNTGILRTVERLAAMARLRVACGAAPLCVRLVKGAYWDAEVKRAQELGLEHYPVFTDKRCTDLAYLAAARLLLDETDTLFPQFATHNPITLGCVLALAGTRRMECQRLHGMGESLQRSLRRLAPALVMRVYAPIGPRRDLLAYLLRRLLENGANTSFVRQAACAADLESLPGVKPDVLG